LAGVPFEEVPVVDEGEGAAGVPSTSHLNVGGAGAVGDVDVAGDVAIAEVLDGVNPAAGLLPVDAEERADCIAVCEELAGFARLRGAAPMSLNAPSRHLELWSGAREDLDRLVGLWARTVAASGGPFLFGTRPTAADAVAAPVCLALAEYQLADQPVAAAYCAAVLSLEPVRRWVAAASCAAEPASEDLDVEF
jgi:glutathione S-transferase